MDLTKSARFRVLILGIMLVKVALFLFLYRPVLGLSLQSAAPPQSAAQPLAAPSLVRGSAPAAEAHTQSRPSAPATITPAEPAGQGDHANDSSWNAVTKLLAALEHQRITLADKEARLRREAEQLEDLKSALREQLGELTAIRTRVSDVLRKKGEMEDEELKRLARVYEATTPEQSGTLLGKLDPKLAAQILARMNGPRAGKVLSVMEPTQAARISQQLLKKE